MLRILLVACIGLAQAQDFRDQFGTTTTRRPSHPPAQVHYVNIGQELAGDYKFGYDTGKGPSGQSFREEVRLPDGTVQGAYGYIDEFGRQRVVKYSAGKDGFKVDGDVAPDEAAPRQQARPRARPQPQPQPQPQQHQPQPQQQPPPQRVANVAPQQAFNPVGHNPQLITIRRQVQQQQPRQFAPQQQFQPEPAPVQAQFRPQPVPRTRTAARIEEEENFGPPVIDAALLSYSIGLNNRRN